MRTDAEIHSLLTGFVVKLKAAFLPTGYEREQRTFLISRRIAEEYEREIRSPGSQPLKNSPGKSNE